MRSVFVESTIFEKYRDKYLNDEDYSLFQAELMSNPCILKVSSKLAQNCKVTAFSGEAVPP
jgi:hypothetical protein